ncbi:patatin-like phospholipase family protein [Mycolicibacter arupensis]|uniref:Esterase n=1 Tax=Mycolicibacter arupensis TaxID=342002 RepID=A0A0F5MZ57_9MYCO|nr:patatin-like phospholipase family protein [Mycolicibacter arupensis]KKB99879.1 esterase [Mycolicibacter arupensis]MCV7277190.1 patatin-like phospholipase family protein [Mycolicibacter arupensis]OQZ96909.1 esterase [Mycolicibacter arupensis]
MTSAAEHRAARPPRVALVLGSGGARGYAHIGVIAELRDRGFDIVGISGSSMGALVGGLEAAGRLDDFAEWAKSLTQGAVLRLLDPSFTAAGVLRAEKILDVVRDILGDTNIEDLPIPYTAVATDLIAGRSVWLQRGPIDTAIRASIAIPGVIAPHVVDGRLLADGGILDPLPMAPLSSVNADLTLAVSLNGGETTTAGPPAEDAERVVTPGRLNRMWRSTSALLDTSGARSLLDRPTARAILDRFSSGESESGEGEESVPEVPKLGSFEVMNRTIDIAQAALARHQLASHPPDLLIEVPRVACRSLDFHRAAELIDVGRELAARTLDAARPL